MIEYVSLALREAAILLYAAGIDPYLEDLVRNADRMFYFDEGSRAETKTAAKANLRVQRSLTTLEAFS